jgi:aspartokinase/homoserine dehydrogenase 1
MIVHKFGGTSLGEARRFSNVADIVAEHHLRTKSLGRPGTVIVVSAMSQVTNQLIQGSRAAAQSQENAWRQVTAGLREKHLAVVDSLLDRSSERQEIMALIEDRLNNLERLYRSLSVLGELTARGGDAIACFGEQLSAAILAAVLRERGLASQALSASEIIITDDRFGAASPLPDQTRRRLGKRVRPLLEQDVIPVITGYIAATEKGIPTTLGRGGSDYSAAIIGAGLGADEVWIWSDVDGILTADPNIVRRARTLSELSYAEAAELAYYGADVLHPKTIRPVVAAGIPLRILNSFEPRHPGTLIVKTPSPGRRPLPAIISTSGLSLIILGRDGCWTQSLASRALQRLSENGLEVLMFSQSLAEHRLNLVVREQDQAQCLKVLNGEFGGPGDLSLGLKEKVATISVVGVPGWNEVGTISHAFAALGKGGARVISVTQAATENSISFCLPEEQMEDTVRFLHGELGLEN